ncbi:LPD38 domain-containing protein [Heyndrickxia oleronia]|uniref:LPD38 domain-containing protein n=1 Tax=Heyndrickxia oleronia TaxID=38875 RepID=UPI001B04DA16|nr:LPD38 domain-containing protein [Heyndrickxia oleronia]GIN38373.1 hypothetical protein J19TS1_13220 [Heyndrickxia oleronia]
MYTFGPKRGYDAWKEDEQKKEKEKKARVKAGLPPIEFTEYRPIQYRDNNFRATSDIPKKQSFQWEKDLLRDLPTKKYGRSYDDKFARAVKELGGNDTDVKEFRRFLDAREKGMQTKSDLTNQIITSADQRAKRATENQKKGISPIEKVAKVSDKKIDTKKPRTGFNGFLDQTLGRASHEANKLIFGKEFVKKQDEVYQKIADKKKGTTSGDELQQRLNTVNRKAETKLEKGADIIGKGLGIGSYIAPGVAAEKLAIKGMQFGKGTKAGSQIASLLSVKGGESAAKKVAKTATKRTSIGAGGGLIFGVGDTALKSTLNPDDYKDKSLLKQVMLETAIGGVADPLIYGGGQVLKAASNKTMKNLLPSFEKDLGKKLGDILLTGSKSDLPNATQSKNLLEEITPKLNKPMNKEVAASLEKITPKFEAISPSENVPIVKAPINHDIKFDPDEILPNTVDHIGTKTKRDLTNVSGLKTKAYIQAFDNLHPLQEFDKMVENVTNTKLNPSEKTYLLGLNSRGTDQISKQILTENMVNKNGDVVGKSLKDVAVQIPKGKLKNFEDYLINKHAITRMERGEKVFPDEWQMNAQKSASKVAEYEQLHPEFKQIANDYYEFNKQLGQTWLVDTGMISQKQWDQYLEANPYYTPMNRIFKEIEKSSFSNGAKKGFSNQSNPIKKATGSQRKIVSPMESTIEHADNYIKSAKRNEVMQSLVRNIEKDPEAFKGIAEIVPTKETPSDIIESLHKDGVEGLLENFNSAFNQKTDLNKGNVVYGLIDGNKVHVKVHDPQLLEALTNLQPKAQHSVVKAVGNVTRVMKNLTTGINPVFSLTRNIWRDIPTAYVNSKTTHNPITFAKDLVSSIISVGKNDELYRSFKAVGGGHSSPISSDINLLAQSKRSILPQKGLRPLLGKGLGAIENLNNMIEAAPRLAEFKRITKNDMSYDAKMKGLYEANDVTVNFNRRGNFTKELDAFIPYMNAAVQGINKTYRSFKDQPLLTAIKGFSAITIPTVVLYAINHNNPEYNKLSNNVKDNNFLIPNGDGTFTKIPKPMELGPIFGSGVERVLRQWNDQDPEAFAKFGKTVLDNFLPPARTILHPALVDTTANKNYAGIPIVPGDLENLSPRYQYDSKTSEVSKKIGDIFNLSPKKLDYLAKSYGGVIAELGIPATTKNATIGNTLKQKVTADPVFTNDILNNFYDKKTKLDRAQADYSKQGVKTKELNDDLRKEFNKTSREISDIRKEIKAIQIDDSLSPKEREKEIRKLQEEINEIAMQQLILAR